MAKECEDIVNKYVRGKSKWSGEVDILDWSEGYSAAKEWSCNISTLLEIEKHQMIHEHLHARSISHYDVETYKNYALMEELPIEFLAREICEKENIKIVYSKAYDNIKYLRKINELVKIETDDFSFAKALFEIPVKERYGWIENQIYSKADNLGIVDFSKAIEWLEKVNSYG